MMKCLKKVEGKSVKTSISVHISKLLNTYKFYKMCSLMSVKERLWTFKNRKWSIPDRQALQMNITMKPHQLWDIIKRKHIWKNTTQTKSIECLSTSIELVRMVRLKLDLSMVWWQNSRSKMITLKLHPLSLVVSIKTAIKSLNNHLLSSIKQVKVNLIRWLCLVAICSWEWPPKIELTTR